MKIGFFNFIILIDWELRVWRLCPATTRHDLRNFSAACVVFPRPTDDDVKHFDGAQPDYLHDIFC